MTYSFQTEFRPILNFTELYIQVIGWQFKKVLQVGPTRSLTKSVKLSPGIAKSEPSLRQISSLFGIFKLSNISTDDRTTTILSVGIKFDRFTSEHWESSCRLWTKVNVLGEIWQMWQTIFTRLNVDKYFFLWGGGGPEISVVGHNFRSCGPMV